MHQFFRFILLCSSTLHVSDGLSVHHQESKSVHTASDIQRQPPVGQDLLIHEVSRSQTTTHHSRQDSFGRVISSSQRPLPDSTQHSQQTNIHVSGGIRTHDLNRRETADRLRPRGYWDRHFTLLYFTLFTVFYFTHSKLQNVC
jgi:hypothetical protein